MRRLQLSDPDLTASVRMRRKRILLKKGAVAFATAPTQWQTQRLRFPWSRKLDVYAPAAINKMCLPMADLERVYFSFITPIFCFLTAFDRYVFEFPAEPLIEEIKQKVKR